MTTISTKTALRAHHAAGRPGLPHPGTEALEQAARDRVALDADFFGRSADELAQSRHGDLARTGVDYALITLANSNPGLAGPIAAHYARLYLWNGLNCLVSTDGARYLGRCTSTPATRQAVAGELQRFSDYALGEVRETGIPPVLMDDMTARIAQLATGVAHDLTSEQETSLQNLFQATLHSSQLRLDRGGGLGMIDDVAQATVAMNPDSGWVFDWMQNQPAAAAAYARAALAAGRPVPDSIVDRVVDQTVEAASRQDDHGFFYNQDWFAARLHLLSQTFQARDDEAGRRACAERLLASSSVAALKQQVQEHLLDGREPGPLPEVRIKVGDQQVEIGGAPATPAYRPWGPADRGQAVSNLKETCYDQFYEDSGDQAILALADPRFEAEAREGFLQHLAGRSGQFFVRDVVGRLPVLAREFPQEAPAARAAVVDLLAAHLARGGESAEDSVYYLDSSVFDHQDRLRLLVAADELLARPPVGDSDYPDIREASRVQKRGIVFNLLQAELGHPPLEGTYPGVEKILAESDSLVARSFAQRHEDFAQHAAEGLKEESPIALRLAGRAPQ